MHPVAHASHPDARVHGFIRTAQGECRMLTLVAQPLRGVVGSPLRRRRLIGGLLELTTLAAILATLATAVVRIH